MAYYSSTNPDKLSEYWFVIIIEYLVLLIPVFLIIRRYASFKKIPFYTYGSVFFGWYVSMMIIFLLPIDITSVNTI